LPGRVTAERPSAPTLIAPAEVSVNLPANAPPADSAVTSTTPSAAPSNRSVFRNGILVIFL